MVDTDPVASPETSPEQELNRSTAAAAPTAIGRSEREDTAGMRNQTLKRTIRFGSILADSTSRANLESATGGSCVADTPAEIFVSPSARNTGDSVALGCPRDRLED